MRFTTCAASSSPDGVETALDSGDILTRYYDTDNNEIEINTGKTYIGLIPSDSWDSMTLN